MKALNLHGIGDLRLEEVATPQPGENEVLVKVAACGVCGSDIPRIFSKGTYHFPTIPGHEFAGVVAELGSGTSDLAVGDRVAVFPLIWCGRCASCEEGNYVQCDNYGYLGSRNDGGFAEYVLAPRRNLLRIPEEVSLEDAALTEPAAVALHALRRIGSNLLGLTIAVYGTGPIGLMVSLWARAMGASVVVHEIAPMKIGLARSLGFRIGSDADRADVCVEAAGVPATMQAACKSVNRGGTVVLLGNPSRDVTFAAELLSQIMRKEAALLGTWNSDFSQYGTQDDWHSTLKAMAEGKIDLRPLVSHQVPLTDGIATLKLMRDCPEQVCKILIKP